MSAQGERSVASVQATVPLLAAVSGSTVVALVGLSQLLASGALSVTPLGREAVGAGVVAAFVAATMGAFLVAVIARVPGEVCGPRTSIAVIYAVLCADLVARARPDAGMAEVWAALAVAVVLMGLLQVLAGWLRLGDAIKFMPLPVNAGFVTGIGLLIVWSQIGPALGLESRFARYDWADLAASIKPAALCVAILTALAVWILPRYRWFKGVQPLLLGLAAGTGIHHLIATIAGPDAVGPTLGRVVPVAGAVANARALWDQADPQWLFATGVYVLPYAAFLALQAIMNAAVSSVAVAQITGVRTSVNRTIVAQGLANILCGALAALPLGTSPSQSMMAARMKEVSAVVPAASCLVLLVGALTVGEWLSHIPVAALAGILVTVGTGMVDRWARELVGRALTGGPRHPYVIWNLAIVVAVAAAFVVGSVPVALAVGGVLATVLLAVNLSEATRLGDYQGSPLASTRVWPREQAQWLVEARRSVATFRLRGALFFGTADQLSSRLSALPHDIRYCALDLSRLTALDATGCQMVAASARKLAVRGVTTVLAGLDASERTGQELIVLGLTDPDPRSRWFADLDHALEWIETRLLQEHWPHLSVDAPVPLSASPLGKGLVASELEELRAYLARLDVDTGALFRRGEPGSSMFVIDEGFVEIRIGGHDQGAGTRLAAFGPGGIFGEVAMLSSGRRTADAVCLRPSRLYELRREGLAALREKSPTLYTRILENLNIHVANRLVVATGIVQAQR